MKESLNPTPEEQIKSSCLAEICRLTLTLGETGEHIGRMVLDYVEEGFFSWEQATDFLHTNFSGEQDQ